MNRDAFQSQWASMERYRLDVVSAWPPSPYKDATLAAIYSTLASLTEEPATTAFVRCPLPLAA